MVCPSWCYVSKNKSSMVKMRNHWIESITIISHYVPHLGTVMMTVATVVWSSGRAWSDASTLSCKNIQHNTTRLERVNVVLWSQISSTYMVNSNGDSIRSISINPSMSYQSTMRFNCFRCFKMNHTWEQHPNHTIQSVMVSTCVYK